EESAVIGEFYVNVGDTVQVGSRLFSIETGKSVFDVESEFEGVVLSLFCEAGDELPIQAPVLVIGEAGETFEKPPSKTKQADAASASETLAAPKAADIPAVTYTAGQQDALSSPRARSLADKAGVSVAQAQPTGAEGLIIERDVKRMLDTGVRATKPAATEGAYQDMPLSMMRKTIAKAMFQSIQSMAQLTHTASFDATQLLAYRAQCKAQPDTKGITLGDMVLFAVSRTLKQFPEMNAHFLGDTIRRFAGVHLAVAVDIPAGLVVPVIRNADTLSLLQISNEMKRLAAACQNGSIAPELLTGGSFTVSNLGNLGIESFTPIINPPQVGILGVNT
ncbi:MAG: 2-oxo acid dehydrogenase subunit E2, partial [Firmicutes bacterium]|nr:2-oxo acid dehydrogenase subunit E2 [Bacillota bacterium]